MIAAGKPEELFVAPNKDVQEFVGDSVEFLPKDGSMSVCSLTMKQPATALLLIWHMTWASILVSVRENWRTSVEPLWEAW